MNRVEVSIVLPIVTVRVLVVVMALVMQVIEVTEVRVTVQGAVPITTLWLTAVFESELRKPVPVIVISVPPCVLPEEGATPVMTIGIDTVVVEVEATMPWSWMYTVGA